MVLREPLLIAILVNESKGAHGGAEFDDRVD